MSKIKKDKMLKLSVHENVNILDEPVPNINVDILLPVAATKPKLYDRIKQNLNNLRNKIKSEVNKVADWILKYVPPPIKKAFNSKVSYLISKVNHIFNTAYIKKTVNEIIESKSAIKGFAKQYTVDGWDGIDAFLFLNNTRSQVVSLLSNNRQTKVNLVLTCSMKRVNIKS